MPNATVDCCSNMVKSVTYDAIIGEGRHQMGEICLVWIFHCNLQGNSAFAIEN